MQPHETDAFPEIPKSSDSAQAFPTSNLRWSRPFLMLDVLSSQKYCAQTYAERHGHGRWFWTRLSAASADTMDVPGIEPGLAADKAAVPPGTDEYRITTPSIFGFDA